MNQHLIDLKGNPELAAVMAIAAANKYIYGIDFWRMIRTMTVKVFSWTGSSSPRAASVGV